MQFIDIFLFFSLIQIILFTLTILIAVIIVLILRDSFDLVVTGITVVRTGHLSEEDLNSLVTKANRLWHRVSFFKNSVAKLYRTVSHKDPKSGETCTNPLPCQDPTHSPFRELNGKPVK